MILVDSNVLLDVLQADPVWFEWSSKAIIEHGQSQQLAINPIIYAEVSVAYDRIEAVDSVLDPGGFRRLQLPYEAGFLAGKCFVRYRRRGGTRRSPLPDFYIGAHASLEQMPLLTRDASRYADYFPRLKLIAP